MRGSILGRTVGIVVSNGIYDGNIIPLGVQGKIIRNARFKIIFVACGASRIGIPTVEIIAFFDGRVGLIRLFAVYNRLRGNRTSSRHLERNDEGYLFNEDHFFSVSGKSYLTVQISRRNRFAVGGQFESSTV